MQRPDFSASLKTILDKLFRKDRQYTPQPGDGVARAAERLENHRKAWLGVNLSAIDTRQQRRARERAIEKAFAGQRKTAAMREKKQGGAAACR